MKLINFSRYFFAAFVFSVLIVALGLAGYFVKGGFRLGVDFQAGLLQEVQIVPMALEVTYEGRSQASISMSRTGVDIVITGADIENTTHSFPYADYPSIASLASAIDAIPDVSCVNKSASGAESARLVQSSRGNPSLGEEPYIMHYREAGLPVIPIDEVRDALSSLGESSVQVLGDPLDRAFMVRLEENDEGEAANADKVLTALLNRFGENSIAVTRSDYVGSRFSKQLQGQASILFAATLALILLYCAIRFKLQYAIGAVIALIHDAIVMVCFIVWTGMEFNTLTIAAILTVIGYSLNDTIVVFDRMRENLKLNPESGFLDIVDMSLSATLGRTIITTVTTMLAVLALFFFTTGQMKDFALVLLVGMTSGVYSTIFIAASFVLFWEKKIGKKRISVKKVAAIAAQGLIDSV